MHPAMIDFAESPLPYAAIFWHSRTPKQRSSIVNLIPSYVMTHYQHLDLECQSGPEKEIENSWLIQSAVKLALERKSMAYRRFFMLWYGDGNDETKSGVKVNRAID